MKERLKNVPLQPGVYIYKDGQGQVLYVGKARVLRQRMRSYFQSPDRLLPKVKAMMARVADFDYIVTGNEVEALILENNLIKAYQPRYNIQLRDDKSYPYLKLSGEQFPRISVVREKKDQVSRYFGPYTEAGSLKETVKLLTAIFPLRTCKHLKMNQRACLKYDLGRCLAPCRGLVSEEEYQLVVDDLIHFLEGNPGQLLALKEEEMKKAAAQMEFEKAARLRDQIKAIKVLGEKQQASLDHPYNLDLVGMVSGEQESLVLVFKLRGGKIIAKDTFWLKRGIEEEGEAVLAFFFKQYYDENLDIPREILVNNLPGDLVLVETWLREKTGHRVNIRIPERGDKRRLLDMVVENAHLLWEEKTSQDQKSWQALVQLARVLDLGVVPERIECYDISHLAGQETVASMVVFTKGHPDKKSYRRFKIRSEQNDDYASLAETVKRRLNEAGRGNQAFLPEPDLMLIDGGLGQVNAVESVLRQFELDIPLVGLAKKNEEIFLPGQPYPLVLSRRDEGLMLLQRLRDEAHRFALEYSRQRRSQKLTRSILDQIEGVGPQRKKALLSHFGSLEGVKKASLEELKAAPGVNRKVAEQIYKHFHSRLVFETDNGKEP